MKSGRPIDISKASLVSLKAELIRKKEEADKLRGSESYVKLPVKPKLELKANPGVSQRNERDVAEMSSEEVDLLQKSRDILKIKSSLYNQLQSGALVSEDGKSRYLVDFGNKPLEETSENAVVEPPRPAAEETKPSSEDEIEEDDDGWVEYKDCLGRSRKCLREDLPAMQERDLILSAGPTNEATTKEDNSTPAPQDEDQLLRELVHSDGHLEELRKKWEQKEMELLTKQNVHYEDLLFDEARSHGVGYWKFSTDEAKRMEEQEMLRKIRTETEQRQKEAKALRERREQQRQARLIAARQRQRARLGLPPIDPKEIIIESQETKEPEIPSEEISEDLEIRLKKAAHVRPWDVGKDGAQQPLMTQEEWVEKKRDERIEEFAPVYARVDPTSSVADDDEPFVGPMPSQPPVKIKKKKKKKKKVIGPTPPPQTLDIPLPDEEPPEESNPFFSRTKNFLKKRNAAKAGLGEQIDSTDAKTVAGVSRGAAIPPPMDFDYHTPASRRRPTLTSSSHQETAEAIEAGLRLLRQQFENNGTPSGI